jgi:hypothetical protein
MILALLLMTVAVSPASAQVARQRDDTATQQTDTDRGDLIWNLVGLLGLIGLIGLLPQHEEDSYHPTTFDE